MWRKVTKATFSGASSVSIDGCFSALYKQYMVVRNFAGSTDDIALGVRLRVAAADASGTDYRRQYISAAGTTIAGSRSTGATSWDYGMGSMQAAAFGFTMLRISNPFDAVRTTAWNDITYAASGNICIERRIMEHDLATSYDGFSILPVSGTITGSITVYGLQEN